MRDFLQGGTMLGCFAIAVFFLRYWKDTDDRLFAAFAAAFTVLGLSRIALHATAADSETQVWVYGLRALAFAVIIGAVVDKNLREPPG